MRLLDTGMLGSREMNEAQTSAGHANRNARTTAGLFAETEAALANKRQQWEVKMSVAKVIELTSTSSQSFEDAIQQGAARASKTLKNVQSAWIKEQQVNIENGRISAYRVNMMITFVLDGDADD